VHTATISGVEAVPVTVEVSVGNGLPGTYIVGMADTAINEARFRVRLACRAAGFEVPNRCIVINLAPSSLRKSGSGLDLPIALGLLIATGQISPDMVAGRLCVGELSIDGSVHPVNGQLAYEHLAFESGLSLLTAPIPRGVYPAKRHEHLCLSSLADLYDGALQPARPREVDGGIATADFCDVAGNDFVKRALQIAAVGKHAILLLGPPGSGKSMLASRLPSILPPLSDSERIESAMIHSVAGLPYEEILQGKQPFRAPHHSASRAGLLGGGNPLGPGEVTLAHNGVLFLDEMPEFGSSLLQLLRQPIENGYVALARANRTLVFPADFLLVGAANPCPCGYYGDPQRACKCSEAQISNYQGRIGGPIMDRFDMAVQVRRSDPAQVLATGQGVASKPLRTAVLAARDFRQQRQVAQDAEALDAVDVANGEAFAGVEKTVELAAAADVVKAVEAIKTDAGADCRPRRSVASSAAQPMASARTLGNGMRMIASCRLGSTERRFIEQAATRYQLSGRGIMRALSVARTIADLEASERVNNDHLLEAVSFRFENGGF
jgi:magnesium chelatase family protein